MSDTDLHWLSLVEASECLRRRELSPVELTQALLARIERHDPALHAFARLTPDSALESARRAERELGAGEARGPLHGVPLAVKDLCAIKGEPTASGTQVLRDHRPDHTATVVERLEAAGAVILGKLQLTEGAYGWHHPAVTPPINPWNADFWTGVSSSGSGVATAAGLCFGSLGSDTGGSIRFPSGCCGLTGIKPSYGRVSRFGVFPLAHTLDHVGPMARSVADAAALLGVLAGHDPRDPSSLRAAVPDYAADLEGGAAGVRIGIDRKYVSQGVSAKVQEVLARAERGLAGLGARIVDLSLPPVDTLVAGWVMTTAVECSLAHAHTFPAHADRYGPELRTLLELAPQVSGAQYAAIEIERVRFRAALDHVFEQVDLLLVPAMPETPMPAERSAAETLENPANAEGGANLLQFTAPFDYTGSPTLSLPGGFTSDGVPLGFQLVGPHLSEARLCRVGQAWQQSTDWHLRRPGAFA